MNTRLNIGRLWQPNIPETKKPIIIWDLDGTVIDESLYRICAQQIFKKVYGLELSDEEYDLHFDQKSYCETSTCHFLESKNVNHSSHPALNHMFEQIDQKFRGLIKLGKVETLEFSIRLLHAFHDLGHRQALVTGASLETVNEALASLVPNYFEVIATRENTFWQKPHPHPYLLCFQQLDVTPQDCMIIENSPEGIIAAQASGANSFNVATLCDIR